MARPVRIRRPGAPRSARTAGTILFAAVAATCAGSASAQVVTDGTVGPIRTLSGSTLTIGPELGQQRGGNLFHSFRTFSVAAGQTADFTGPASVQRVLARVTGGSPTAIDGTLRCSIDGASLYLVNPAGVVIGEGATVDVGGSLAVTTADYLKLSDGVGRFDARAPANSVLTSAPPAAFGFLALRPAGVSIRGTFTVEDEETGDGSANAIELPPGAVLTVAAGEVRISTRSLLAPGGRVNLVAVRNDPTEVPLDAEDPAAAAPVLAEDRGGLVELLDEAGVDVSADRAGRVVVRGGDVVFDEASFADAITGGQPGGGIDVAGDSLVLTFDGALTAGTTDAGTGGPITVTARTLVDVSDGGLISSFTEGSGRGGDVVITAPEVILDGFGQNEFLTGIMAEVGLDAAGGGGTGRGGDVTINTGHLGVFAGAVVSTTTFGPGAGGNLVVNAPSGTVELDGNDADGKPFLGFTGLTASTQVDAENGGTSSGPAGSVRVEAAEVLIVDLGGIASNSFFPGAGPGGSITVRADSIEIDDAVATPDTLTAIITASGTTDPATVTGGPGGAIDVRAGSVRVTGDGARISAATFGGGDGAPGAGAGGSVTVAADGGGPVDLLDGGVVTATTFGAGAGGSVTVDAGVLTIRGVPDAEFTGVFARSAPPAGSVASGPAGSVAVTARDVRVTGPADFAQNGQAGISAQSTAAAGAGDVTVMADRIAVSRRGALSVAAPQTTSRAGRLTVGAARALVVTDRGRVTAESGRDGGDVAIGVGDVFRVDRGRITASAAGDGGTLTIGRGAAVAPDAVAARLAAGRPVGAARAAAAGRPPVIVLGDSVLDARSQGRPVKVTVVADEFLRGADTRILTDRPIDVPETDVSGALAALRAATASSAARLVAACGPRFDGAAGMSSFVQLGRGGAPLAPGGVSPDGVDPAEGPVPTAP